MKKLILLIIAIGFCITSIGQSRHDQGIKVGTGTSIAVIKSITSTNNDVKFYDGTRDTLNPYVPYSERIKLSDVSFIKADTNTLKNPATFSFAARKHYVFNNQTGTSYTGVLSDDGKIITMSNSAANTFTIPPNSSVAYEIGTTLVVVQWGDGETTIAPGTDVVIINENSYRDLRVKGSGVQLVKQDTNIWWAVGGLEL